MPGPWVNQFTVTCCFITVYAATLYPTVPGGDSGELIAAACSMGVPHPPGYPLHTLLGHLFVRALPGTPAARVNFLSAVCSATTAGVLFSTIETLSAAVLDRVYRKSLQRKNSMLASRLGALLAVGMYGFSPLVWMYSTQAEVFALNNLFAALIVSFSTRILLQRPAPSPFSSFLPFLGAFTVGLGLSNQHTLVLISAPMALAVLRGKGTWELLHFGSIATLAGCFSLGLVPYLYLIVVGSLPAEGAWGDITTLSGLLLHVTRKEYGSLQLYPGSGGPKQGTECLLVGGSLYFVSVWKQFGALGTALISVGTLAMLWVRGGARRAGVALCSAWVLYVVVFHSLANLPVVEGEHRALFREVLSRFWLLPNTLLAVPMGCGGGVALGMLPSLVPRGASSWGLAAAEAGTGGAVAAAVAAQALANWRESDKSGEWGVWEAGMEVLASVPRGGLLLVKGDLITNAVRYLMLCEGSRGDVLQVDLAHASYRWFGLRQALAHYSGVVLPGPRLSRLGLNDTYRLSAALAENVRRPTAPQREEGAASAGRGEGAGEQEQGGSAGAAVRPVVLSAGLGAQYGEEQLQGVELWPSGVLQRAFARGEGPGAAGAGGGLRGLRAWALDCAVRVPGVKGGAGGDRGEGGAAGRERGGEGAMGQWERVAEQEGAAALPNVALQMLAVALSVPPAPQARGSGGVDRWWARVGCRVVGQEHGEEGELEGRGWRGCVEGAGEEGEAKCRLRDLEGCAEVLGGEEELRREEWVSCAAQLLLCVIRAAADPPPALWRNLGVAHDTLLALHPGDRVLQRERVGALSTYVRLSRCRPAGGGDSPGESAEDVAQVLALEGVTVTC